MYSYEEAVGPGQAKEGEETTAPQDRLIRLQIWKGQNRSSVELISKLSGENLRNDCHR